MVSYPSQPRGALPALNGVSCELVPGRITSIIGPNGAGKSTLLRAFAGVRQPTTGRIELDGRAVWSMRPRERARRIALAVQQPGVAFGFDARRVVSFGAEGAGLGPASVDRAIERFEIGTIADQSFETLSVGQQQRVSLARAFAQIDAKTDAYLLADEPCSAMDPRHAVNALRAIRALASTGVGVAIVLHDLSLAASISDHAILITDRAKVLASGPAGDVLTSENLSELFRTPMIRREIDGVGTTISHIEDPNRSD